MTKLLALVLVFFSVSARAAQCPVDCNGNTSVKPFDYVKKAQQAGDPNTGGPLRNTFLIPTTEGGTPNKEVSSSEFLGGINEFEEWTAKECGESLETDGDVLVSAPCNNDAINRRTYQYIVGMHKPSGAAVPSITVINNAFAQAKNPAVQEAQKQAIWFRIDGVALRHQNCFPQMGFETPGKDIFAVYALASFCSGLTASSIPNSQQWMLGAPADAAARFTGSAKAGIFIFNEDLNIARVTTDLVSPYQKNVSRNLKAMFFGKVLYTNNDTAKDLTLDYVYPLGSIQKGVSTTFTIGPVPITVEAGATGSVDVNFMLRQAGFWANGEITPRLDTTAYARGMVYAVIAKAGVEINVNPLFRDTLRLYGLAVMAPIKATGTDGKPYLTFIGSSQTSFLNEVQALSGQFNLFLSIIRPKFIGWKWKKFVMNLFSWNGVSAKGYIHSNANLNVPVAGLK